MTAPPKYSVYPSSHSDSHSRIIKEAPPNSIRGLSLPRGNQENRELKPTRICKGEWVRLLKNLTIRW